MKTRLIILFGLMTLAACASEIPEATLPAGVGVNIHFIQGHEKDLDMIAEAGFKWVRMDFAWDSIEKKKGSYDWTAYDELTANLEKRGLKAIYILDYSNPLYEGKVDSKNAITQAPQPDVASPQHPESIVAFAKWASTSANHFHGKHIIWEFFNEPNGFFWKPKPDVAQYSALTFATAKAIRDVEPKATLIGPACAAFDWAFLEAFLKSGILKYLDGVSVHPYRGAKDGPETAGADYDKLRALIEKYAPNDAKKKMPIISGEWGYPSNTGGVSPEVQAAFAIRQQLFNLLKGVPLSIWYDWKNDGKDVANGEHNFGTVSDDLTLKPAYTGFKVMTQALGGYHIVSRFDTEPNDYVLLLANAAGNKKVVGWTTVDVHARTIKTALKANDVTDAMHGMGFKLQPNVGDVPFRIDMENFPQYYTLKPSAKP